MTEYYPDDLEPDDWGEWDGEGLEPPPFDALSAEDQILRDILEEIGIADINEIIVAPEDVIDPSTIRGYRYNSPQDALMFAYSIGVLNFSQIVFFSEINDDTGEEDEYYGLQIDDNTN